MKGGQEHKWSLFNNQKSTINNFVMIAGSVDYF